MDYSHEQVLEIIDRIETRLAIMRKQKYEFYNECGISSAAYSFWKTGKNSPSNAKLSKIAEYLGVSFEWLVNGDEEPTYDDETMRIREQILNRPEVRMLFQAISDDVPASEILNATAQIMKYKEQNK